MRVDFVPVLFSRPDTFFPALKSGTTFCKTPHFRVSGFHQKWLETAKNPETVFVSRALQGLSEPRRPTLAFPPDHG
jgi:hypothetical protein